MPDRLIVAFKRPRHRRTKDVHFIGVVYFVAMPIGVVAVFLADVPDGFRILLLKLV